MKAYQSFDAVSGRKIKLYSWSFNAEKDNAKAWISVGGTENNLGNITNFADQAYASATNANASQNFKTATGNEIEFGVLSSNKEKDKADVSMEIKKGSVSNFTAKADTTAVNASASLVNSSASSLISGKRLVFEARTSDALGDLVRAITNVENGTFTGRVADIAFVDTSTNTLNASQRASTLEGTSLDADRKASNVTWVTVHKTTKIDNPSISNYQNSASVIAGTPSVVPP